MTAFDDKKPIRIAPVVQTNSMPIATTAAIAVHTNIIISADCINSAANIPAMAVIIIMFAISPHHCSATFNAMYFLLSGAMFISRRSIIIVLIILLLLLVSFGYLWRLKNALSQGSDFTCRRISYVKHFQNEYNKFD